MFSVMSVCLYTRVRPIFPGPSCPHHTWTPLRPGYVETCLLGSHHTGSPFPPKHVLTCSLGPQYAGTPPGPVRKRTGGLFLYNTSGTNDLQQSHSQNCQGNGSGSVLTTVVTLSPPGNLGPLTSLP